MKYATIAGIFSLMTFANAQAQLNLGVDGKGLSIGNSTEWTGIRFNYRDRDVQDIRGLNVTVLSPRDPATGTIRGTTVGLISTGAREIHGLGIATLGVAASDNISGAVIGGLGAGAGGDITGLAFGGFGLGAGGSISGLSIGGFGLAAGEDLKGGSLAIFGMGAGGDMSGFGVAGFGMGAGGDITGIHIAGFGLGSGGTIKGASAAFFGIGADRMVGLNLAATLQARQMVGIALAPAYLKVQNSGNFHGLGVSAYNEIRGHTKGLTIGLVNYTRTLNGVQIGLVNVVRENPKHRQVLPVANWNFE